ncbi:MAG: cell division protein FtsZ [Bacteroidales bacterium]|nr:cell division protein FtsZ [Bacteroidales bacterium]
MEEITNSQLFDFDSPLNQSSYIKVVGVGGGGNNAVNHMFRNGIEGVDFIVCNTDMKALNASPVANKLVLGRSGLGAGNAPAKARKAAEAKEQEIRELFEHNTKMVFITAGMGGGTGTGAAPVIARIAKEIKIQEEEMEEEGHILVVAVVTTPFYFEGKPRLRQALEGVEELQKYVDSILVINNERLRSYGNLVMSQAFSKANDVLLTAVKGIAEIITHNAYVNIDFRDVNTVMENSGTALMGIGEGDGESRAIDAVKDAATSVLLDSNDISGSKNVLLYFSYSHDHEITMDEMGDVTDYICERTGSDETTVIWGAGEDDTLGSKVKVTLIATGYEPKERPEPQTFKLEPEKPAEPPRVTPPADPSDIHIVHPEVKETPVESVKEQEKVQPVIENVQPQVVADTPQSRKHVINLYDDEAKPVEKKPEETSVTDDGLRLVNRKERVVAEAGVAPEAEVQKPVNDFAERPATQTGGHVGVQTSVATEPQTIRAFDNNSRQNPSDKMVFETMSRAERIRKFHHLLRNDANGPEIIEKMNPVELVGDRLFETVPSSESTANTQHVASDGTVKPNPYLFNSVD